MEGGLTRGALLYLLRLISMGLPSAAPSPTRRPRFAPDCTAGGILLFGSVIPRVFEPGAFDAGAVGIGLVVPVVAVQLCARENDELAAIMKPARTIRMGASCSARSQCGRAARVADR